jgi:hypothetical protein
MSEPNNFEELRQLLKLKRHEVPPPGYFNHFSGDVISRIQAGETRGAHGLLERFEGSWVMDVLQIFQAKPGIIGGFATSLCLLLLIGVVLADRPESSGSSSAANDSAMASAAAPDTASPLVASANLLPAGDSGITISTNAIHSLQPAPALFGPQQNPLFQNASFVQPGQ